MMSLQLAIDVVLDQGACREATNRSQVIAAALALSTATISSGNRDLLDAAAGLHLLATAGTMELDQTGRDRAMHLANAVSAFDWRQQYGCHDKGGVVVVFEGKAQGWVNELRNPEHWQPGCVAINDTGQAWTAVGGDEQNGAAMWIPGCRSVAMHRQ